MNKPSRQVKRAILNIILSLMIAAATAAAWLGWNYFAVSFGPTRVKVTDSSGRSMNDLKVTSSYSQSVGIFSSKSKAREQGEIQLRLEGNGIYYTGWKIFISPAQKLL